MAVYLTESDVDRLLDMPTAIACVESAHAALARGDALDIPRQRARGGSATQHILQACWPQRRVMGYKAYTSTAKGARFWLHLFDSETGSPLAVIEADGLGMYRTGAAGAVAAKHLANADARYAGIIGAGWQARGQMIALAQVRAIEVFKVFARNADKLAGFCNDMSRLLDRPVQAVASARAAVEGSDVIATVTTSPKPVLEGEWLSAGVHINAAGSNSLVRRELDEAAVLECDLICVDSVETALKEAGDLLPAIEKGRVLPRRLIELGDIVAGVKRGRVTPQQITLFESQGMAIQDIALGVDLLERAKMRGMGQALPY